MGHGITVRAGGRLSHEGKSQWELRVFQVGRAVREERAAGRISEGDEEMWRVWNWFSFILTRVRSIRGKVNNSLERSSKVGGRTLAALGWRAFTAF